MADNLSKVEFEKRDDVHVFRFRDVSLLDETVYQMLSDAIHKIREEGDPAKTLVVCMERVKLVSTAVWAKLFVLGRGLQKDEGKLALCSLGPLLREAVRLLKLDKLIPVYDTVDEAVKEVTY